MADRTVRIPLTPGAGSLLEDDVALAFVRLLDAAAAVPVDELGTWCAAGMDTAAHLWQADGRTDLAGLMCATGTVFRAAARARRVKGGEDD